VVGLGRPQNASVHTNDSSRLLIAATFPLLLGLTFGPLTEAFHLFLLAPGLAGVLMCHPWKSNLIWPESIPLLVAGLLWLLLFGLLLSPITQLELTNVKLAPSNPTVLMILWTARLGFVLLALGGATAWLLERMRFRDSEAVTLRSRQPITSQPEEAPSF
jgi:hypothetical protein